jgi:acyl-CoA synthetase (AMP-forming)/AMP-acid ligase II
MLGGEAAQDALVARDAQISRAALAAQVAEQARRLRAMCGPLLGRAVGVSCKDPMATVTGVLAAWSAGAAAVPLGPHAGGLAERVGLRALLHAGPAGDLEIGLFDHARHDLEPDVALLLPTSGSTGAPRIVVIGAPELERNLDAVLAYLPIREHPRTGVVLPLHYSYALCGQVLTTLRAGGSVAFAFDAFPADQLETLLILGARGLSSVAPSLAALATAALDRGRDLPAATSKAPMFSYLASAGGPLPRSTIDLLRRAFPATPIFNQYGLTEAAPRVTFVRSDDPAFERGSAGRPIDGVELTILDAEGQPCAPGVEGALCVRTPSAMRRYLDDPEATARALRDGLLVTGDVGMLDETGALHITGRNDDIVKVAGEKVSLAFVARAIEGAGEAFVAAVADERWGQRLVAFVARTSVADARARARALPPAARPARFVVVDELPRLPSGKVDRITLKERAASEAGERRAESSVEQRDE